MKIVLRDAQVFSGNAFKKMDVLIDDGKISAIAPCVSVSGDVLSYDLNQCFLFPGFSDVHVHLREPGFSYKETIGTGTLAAARGGYTSVCAMPNLSPVPDSVEHLDEELTRIREDAVIHVYPYGALTVNEAGEELADISGMSAHVIGYSDDGRGVQDADLMREAMHQVKKTGRILSAHCEDNSLLRGGYIHDGDYARAHGHRGICSESEWGPIARDLKLVEETGCPYHVCHISCKESVRLIREAKARGVDVTCETGPHYLLMDDSQLQEEGRFKMNPPIRGKEDREALIEGLLDGTIDMIATDHAPHSAEEKSRGLEKSAMGIVGIETAFAELYTHLVKPGILPLQRLVELLTTAPGRRFGIGTTLEVGQDADLTAFELDTPYEIDPAEFVSLGKATPFAGDTVYGRCRMTMVNGRIVWQEHLIES
ncbi:MAG: dihydroorotase [Ruminococcaceae bacterium]|nr:dihydroorotase [Oscillospiraceae bacterium]